VLNYIIVYIKDIIFQIVQFIFELRADGFVGFVRISKLS